MAEDRRFPLGPGHSSNEALHSLAQKAWRAKERGTGMRLTAEEVVALHWMEGDGDWWNSFHRENSNHAQG